MRQILVNITDPSKEKLVTDILREIAGVEVQLPPVKTQRSVRRNSKVAPAKVAKLKKPLTPNEKKFVKGLTQAFKDMNDHIAGRKKLKTLDELLNEL